MLAIALSLLLLLLGVTHDLHPGLPGIQQPDLGEQLALRPGHQGEHLAPAAAQLGQLCPGQLQHYVIIIIVMDQLLTPPVCWVWWTG